MTVQITVERGAVPLRPDQLDALRAAVGDPDAVVVERGRKPGGAVFHVTQRLEDVLSSYVGGGPDPIATGDEAVALAERRASLLPNHRRLRDGLPAIDAGLAALAADRIDRGGLTLVYAEPGAEKESYGRHLAVAAGVPFHGVLEAPADAARVAAAGAGIAAVQADGVSMALRELRRLLEAVPLDGKDRPACAWMLDGMESGTCRVAALPVPGTYAASLAA